MTSIDKPVLSLIPFERFENKETLLLEVAKTVIFGKLYYVHYGRNAWQGWEEYIDTFQLSFDEAKQAVQQRRKKGSTWIIQEIPACIFIGTKWSLIVSEINNDVVLAVHKYSSACKPYLHNIAECFVPPKEGSIIRFIANTTSVNKPFDSVYRSFRSESYGGYYSLSWHEGVSKKYNQRALLKIKRAHEESPKKYRKSR